jgi:predicted O-methyltransferase YrrM
MVSAGDSSKILEYVGLLGDVAAFYRTYWENSLDWLYGELVLSLREPADLLSVAAFDADSRSLPEAAVCFAEAATRLSSDRQYMIVLAAFARKAGDIVRARAICHAVLQQDPAGQQALSELFMCEVAERFWARDYYDLLAQIHTKYRPRVYLEIGVATGKSLALVQQETRVLGVDPVTAEASSLVYHSPRKTPQLYRVTSDEFFATHDVRSEMGRPQFDLAFIDGLHHFDQVLRDFINIEQFAGPDSLVLIHDCLPVDPLVATRERTTAFWTGDVWRIIPCLKAVRPDLEIITLPLAPAGLAVVRRLDPGSRVLSRHFTEVVEQFEKLELPVSWDERCRLLAVMQDQVDFSLDQVVPQGSWI